MYAAVDFYNFIFANHALYRTGLLSTGLWDSATIMDGTGPSVRANWSRPHPDLESGRRPLELRHDHLPLGPHKSKEYTCPQH
jgi:hypothetical protein